ncbi:MAG: glycosyl transferase [Paenibacillaceae bacterium]|jgi:glycosyltransferase involved in cell wall biosynthesis|nr:glycosyl transferase [Paenibacillaceae bacterium]
MDKERTLAVIPAYNEQQSIMKVIRDIRQYLPECDVLVVNDCSRDRTSEMARNTDGDVLVVDLCCNLGIGGAVQTGFKYAHANDYDYVIQIDGDGQHPPGEARKLYDAIRKTGSDMVIGSRFLDVSSFRTTRSRRLGIKVFYYLFRLLIRTPVTDGTSGFRIYNRKAIDLLSRLYPEDYPEPDAIILLNKYGLSICEVGVEMKEREHGHSSITPIKSPYYMAKVIISIFFSYIRAR